MHGSTLYTLMIFSVCSSHTLMVLQALHVFIARKEKDKSVLSGVSTMLLVMFGARSWIDRRRPSPLNEGFSRVGKKGGKGVLTPS